MLCRIFVAIAIGLFLFPGCRNEQTRQVATQSAQTDAHPLEAFEERNDDPIAAATDRFQRRLSADGTVPDRALLNAKFQRDGVLAASSNGAARILPEAWTWLGPGNIGGRLRPIVIHPTEPDIMYVGSASGGIWKTIDGGQNWFVLDDFLPSLSIADMVMHPTDPDTLFAGSGEGFFEAPEGSSNTAFVRGAGIFVSNDAGANWNQMASTDNPDFYFVNRLAFDPIDPNTMLAATLTGIWRTTDGGQTWSQRQTLLALDVKFDPNNPLNVIAGGHDIVGGPYFSTDRGVTWQQATGAEGDRQEIGWAPNQPGTVYAAVSQEGRIKVWRSTDSGQNYSLQTVGAGIFTLAAYNNTIWVDPTDANFMIVGGVRLFSSTNGGVNFTQTFNAVHADMHRIVPHPDFDGASNTTVYFATDGGIYQTDNIYGTSAFDLNNNLGVTQFYGAGINPTTGEIVGGTQDNGTLFYSGDPQDWFHLFGGDGGYGAADPTDPNYFYGEVQRAFIHRSTDGGQSASYIYNGPNPIEDAGSEVAVNFIPFFLLDPNDPNRMLVACERLWRSNNVKDAVPDWFSIKQSIQLQPPGGGDASRDGIPQSHFNPNSPFNLSTIAIAEGNSDIVWAAHNNGQLFVTANGTNATPVWTRVDENGAGLPDRWISTVVIDRHDDQHVYVALMGWENNNLWETTDGGMTWTDVSATGPSSIPDAPISALNIHRNFSGWLYVGTDVGVFTSEDNGLSWTAVTGGPGNAPVEQLLWKNDDELLAVTHGRGMYLADLQVLLGDVNRDGEVNLLDVAPFVDRLISGEFQAEADINQDGNVDLLDIQPFVDLLI